MDKESYYALLESKFLTYREYASIPVRDNGDPLVSIGPEFEGKVANYESMRPYTGDSIYVRSQLIPMLISARKVLKTVFPDYDLKVVCGYRHPEIQEKTFASHLEKIQAEDPSLKGDDLKEAVHRFVAVPEVAGHPTGGAVDVMLIDSAGNDLNMGTSIEDSKDSYVHSPFIDKDVWHRRQILRTSMLQAGFAPTDSEWWHFSYGDREWAKYYNQSAALFEQLRFQL